MAHYLQSRKIGFSFFGGSVNFSTKPDVVKKWHTLRILNSLPKLQTAAGLWLFFCPPKSLFNKQPQCLASTFQGNTRNDWNSARMWWFYGSLWSADFTVEPPWKANSKSVRFGGCFFVVVVVIVIIIFVWLFSAASIRSCYLFIHFLVTSGASMRVSDWICSDSAEHREGRLRQSEQGLPASAGNRGATPTLSTP